MTDYLLNLVDRYQIISVEDPLDESDWSGWKEFSAKAKDLWINPDNLQIVGDDITTRNLNVTGLSTFTGFIDVNGGANISGGSTLDVLEVTGISTFGGLVSVGGTTGTDGQYLRSTGVGVTWSSFPTMRTSQSYTATEGQTTFNFTYNVNLLDVFLNGVKLTPSEYTASNGSTVVLNSGCFAGDTIDLYSYNVASTGSSGGPGPAGAPGPSGSKGQKGEAGSGPGGGGAKGQKGEVGSKGQKGQTGADNSTKGQKGEVGSGGSGSGISTISGVVNIASALDVDGHTELDNLNVTGVTTIGAVNWGGHMIPTSNALYDIGTAEKKVRHLFLSDNSCLLYTSPSPRDRQKSRMPSSA